MARVVRQDQENSGYRISVTTGTGAGGSAKQEPAGEFARFEDLAAKLVQVSKSEVDEKRKTP